MSEENNVKIIDESMQSTSSMNNEPVTPEPLPNAMKSFIFGIVSIATSGFIVTGIIFGIIARKKSAQDQPLFDANPEKYRREAWKLKLGKILGLVGLLLGCFMILYYILLGVFMANV